MRNSAITAMLLGVTLASTTKHFSKKYAFADRLKTLVKRTVEHDEHPRNVLPPDSDCFTWEYTDENRERCEGQWERWDAQCDDRWKVECDRVWDQWFYGSGIEFMTPERPSCEPSPEMSDVCFQDWVNLWDQCMEYTELPYFWTEDCDMIEHFEEAATIISGEDAIFNTHLEIWQKKQ